MRLTQKTLDTLPTVRLYSRLKPKKAWFTVHYMNARKNIAVPSKNEYFKSNGVGLPFICGVSNAILANKDLFNHPVLYVHTIGSVVYIVAMIYEDGRPKLAFRYRHRHGALIEAYDASERDPAKKKQFLQLLKQHTFIALEKGRSEAGKGAHSPGNVSGHRANAPNGDHNKKAIIGIQRRMKNAGYLTEGVMT